MNNLNIMGTAAQVGSDRPDITVDALSLPTDQRQGLVEEVLICSEAETSVPDWHIQILNECENDPPEKGIPWEDVEKLIWPDRI